MRQEEHTLCDQCIKKMVAEKKKAEEKETRRQVEIEKLRTIPIIETVQQLQEELDKIEQDKITIPAKQNKKLELLKNQIRVRNKLLGKRTKITFSISGVQKTFETLINEVSDMLEEESASQKRPTSGASVNSRAKRRKQLATEYLSAPEELVGHDIVHRFANEDSNEEELWDGRILSYNSTTN